MDHYHNPDGPPVDVISLLKDQDFIDVCGEAFISDYEFFKPGGKNGVEIRCIGCDPSECENPEHRDCHPRRFYKVSR